MQSKVQSKLFETLFIRNRKHEKVPKLGTFLASPVGFEPTAFRLSILLRYGDLHGIMHSRQTVCCILRSIRSFPQKRWSFRGNPYFMAFSCPICSIAGTCEYISLRIFHPLQQGFHGSLLLFRFQPTVNLYLLRDGLSRGVLQKSSAPG